MRGPGPGPGGVIREGWRAESEQLLASALRVPVDQVSVKATRPEGLGLTGEGAGCMAVATIGPAADR